MNAIPILPNNTITLWQKQFLTVLGGFEQYAQRLFTFEDEEDVHQARVSLRTITTFTGFLRSSPHKNLDMELLHYLHTRSRLILKTLGKVRDFDVMVGHVKDINQDKFDLKRLNHVLELERQMARIELELNLPKLLDNQFFELWQTFIQVYLPLHLQYLHTKRHFKKLHKKFENRYLTYLAHHEINGAAHLRTFEALHDVRLITKNLRYAYNYLEFALDDETQESAKVKVKQYKKIQEQLGLMNDYTNLREKLKQMLEDYPYLVNKDTLAFRDRLNKKLTKNLKSIVLPSLDEL